MRGPLFVSFEGIDGSGKTTQIGRLVEFLERRERTVRVFREPGGTELGEQIRELVLSGGEVVPWAEVSLFAAARAQLVEHEIRPSLAAGIDVVCDRYLDSSVAYQGLARGLGEGPVLDWNLRVTGGLLPDVTFLLTLSAEDASTRIADSTSVFGVEVPSTHPDRLERESLSFRRRVERAYDELALRSGGRFVSLDASLPQATIAQRISTHVDSMLSADPLVAGSS
jgi:dTMP kinase